MILANRSTSEQTEVGTGARTPAEAVALARASFDTTSTAVLTNLVDEDNEVVR